MKRKVGISTNLSVGDMEAAALRAFRGHGSEPEVIGFNGDFKRNCVVLYDALMDGSWKSLLAYRKLKRRNRNGKLRDIDSPSLETRIYQHLFLNMIEPVYFSKDNSIGLNCKEGCGITARTRNKSVLHRLKHLYYDRRDLNYCLTMDQRKCYEHVKSSVFRRSLKEMVSDKWFVNFAVDVCFINGRLPIGTPTSPMVHHIIMLKADLFAKQMAPFAVRYADNLFLAFRTKEEAQAGKWRMKNFWWYELGIRSKRDESVVRSLSAPCDFCGYVLHRNAGRSVCSHDKGYVTIRESTVQSARKCRNNRSWASYFGLMSQADAFSLMVKIEKKMKLRELTNKIRIDRKMDARHIEIKELLGVNLTVYDYEIRYNTLREANWVKCLVGIDETMDGEKTGRTLAFEFHGNYQGIMQFLLACEKEYGKEKLLPIEEVEIENQCGYIFKDSTNMIEYIDNG